MADVKTINGYTVKDETARTAIENLNTVQLASSGGASGSIRFGVDSNGKYGYYEAGADTVTPFSNGASLELIGEYSGNNNIDISAYPNSSIDDFVLELVEIPASGVGSQYASGWNAYFQGINPVKTISNNTLSITKAQCYIYLATTQSGTWHSASLIKARYNLYRKMRGDDMPTLKQTVVADGVKTISQLLNELFDTAIASTKQSYLLYYEGSVIKTYILATRTNNLLNYNCTRVESSTLIGQRLFLLSNSSTAGSISIDGTYVDESNAVPTSGDKIELYA